MKILQTLGNWARQLPVGGRALDLAVAFGLVAIATLLNLLAWPGGSNQDGHYFALITAVLISALYGGSVPGLVAMVLASLSSSYFTLVPQFSLRIMSPGAKTRLGLFIVEAVLLILGARVIRNQLQSKTASVGPLKYLAIPLAAGAATVPKLLFPEFGRELPFAFNFGAVCACAWVGGLVPGIVATFLLAGITKYLFLEPIYSLSVASPVETIRVGFFVGEGLLLSVLGGSHVVLRRLAKKASARAQTYLAMVMNKEVSTAALEAVSRDTVWEWDVETGEITRTPSWQDKISAALPVREAFASWIERIHAEDRDATVTRLQRAIESGNEQVQYTYRLRDPGGGFLLVWDHAFVVRGSDWKPLRVIGRSAELPSSHVAEG